MAKRRRTCPGCGKQVCPQGDGICPACGRQSGSDEYMGVSDVNELFYEAYDLKEVGKFDEAICIYDHLAARLAGTQNGDKAWDCANRILERFGQPPRPRPPVPERQEPTSRSNEGLRRYVVALASVLVGLACAVPFAVLQYQHLPPMPRRPANAPPRQITSPESHYRP